MYMQYGSYLVLIEVCNDNTHKQSESNHTSQKHKDMNVDAMDLQTQRVRKCVEQLTHCRHKMRKFIVIWKVKDQYRSNTVNNDISDLHPPF